MKRFLLGFVTAVLIGGGFLYFSGQLALPWAGEPKDQAPASAPQATAQAGPPVEVAVYTVKPQEVIFTKDLAGRTSAYQVAEIRPQVTGIILKRMFTQGSLVTKGQQLYQIDPSTYKAAYESAAASLVRAEADVGDRGALPIAHTLMFGMCIHEQPLAEWVRTARRCGKPHPAPRSG